MSTDAKALQTSPAFDTKINGPAIVRNIGALFSLSAVIALGVGIALWAIRPGYVPLYGSIAESDVIQVADALQAQNIPYRIEQSTGLITVPADRVQEVRVKLASVGLPQGSSSGYESLQKEQPMGESQFIESARYHHILETELSRTISAMRNIDSARVHLAMPKQSVFIRKQAKPTASVMIKLFPGRSLEDAQVSSIVHLVASSVPYLESSQVTVVDQWGRLLTSEESFDDMSMTHKQFEYTRKLENAYTKRIEDLLTPLLGMGRVKAEINAEVDFSKNESTQEVYQPDPAKIRSEHVQEIKSDGSTAAVGIPGALSNQPPGAGQTGTAAQQGNGTPQPGEAPRNSNINTTRNFELDKTIKYVKQTQGSITRLSVAVVVDDKTTTAEDGTTSRTPMTDAEVARITELVKTAIGFNEARGDSVSVINSPFQVQPEFEPLPEVPIWKEAWVWGVAKQVFGGIVVVFLFFGIVRPALKNYVSKKPANAQGNVANTASASGSAQGDEEQLTLSDQSMNKGLPSPPHVYGDILNMARAMAAEDPKRVAKVVKNWLASDV